MTPTVQIEPERAAATPRPIRIRESGWTEVSGADGRHLLNDAVLWRLVEAEYVGVSLHRGERVRISARTHIGRAILADRPLEIFEKVPGETASLMQWATRGSFKVERLRAEATEPGDLIALLAEQYLRQARAYASQGRQGVYVDRREVSSLIGGRLRAVPTLRLRSRGLRHLVAFDRPTLSFNTPLNRALLRAIREVETLSRVLSIGRANVSSARSLAMVFADCLDSRFLTTRRHEFLEDAISLRERVAPQLADLLELAAAVLAHLSFEYEGESTKSVPRAWFLDLGTLFEAAVTAALRSVLPDDLVLEEGAIRLPRMFSDVPRRYRADPDLVILRGDDVVCVGDAKHKTLAGRADESDIYQLIAHAATFGARDCFLVYADTAYSAQPLGTNPLGGRTWLFTVDVLDLVGSLTRVSADLGIDAGARAA